MAYGHWPFILVEVVLVFGGVLAFGWWQLRDLERERRKAAESKAAKHEDSDGQDAHRK
jgi:hypothetical protein